MKEQKYEFKSIDSVRLVGKLCLSDKHSGLAVLTHGIPSDMEENGFYTTLAEKLAEAGYDSFRFDFREMGESEKRNVTRLSVNDLICDTESAYLTVDREYKHVCAIGFSCGGGILLKWRNLFQHTEVKDLFLLCPVLDYVYECTGYKREEMVEHMAQTVSEIRIDGYVKNRDEKYGLAFLMSALDFDYDCETEYSTARITVYHGSRDNVAPMEISRSYAAKHNKRVNLVEISGAGHGFYCPNTDETGVAIPTELCAEKGIKMRNSVIDGICAKIESRSGR